MVPISALMAARVHEPGRLMGASCDDYSKASVRHALMNSATLHMPVICGMWRTRGGGDGAHELALAESQGFPRSLPFRPPPPPFPARSMNRHHPLRASRTILLCVGSLLLKKKRK